MERGRERELCVKPSQQTMATSRPNSGSCHNPHTHAHAVLHTHTSTILPSSHSHTSSPRFSCPSPPPPLMTDTVECFVSVPLKRPRRPVPRLSDFRPFVSPALYHINASPLLGARPALTGRLMISRLRSDRVLPSKQTKCL